jgi:hypothetical protein
MKPNVKTKNTAKQIRKPSQRKRPKQPWNGQCDDSDRLAAGRDPRQMHFGFYLAMSPSGEPHDQEGKHRRADRSWRSTHRCRPASTEKVSGVDRATACLARSTGPQRQIGCGGRWTNQRHEKSTS